MMFFLPLAPSSGANCGARGWLAGWPAPPLRIEALSGLSPPWSWSRCSCLMRPAREGG